MNGLQRLALRVLGITAKDLSGHTVMRIGIGDGGEGPDPTYAAANAARDYRRNPWVHKAVSIVARNVRGLSLYVWDDARDVEVERHPVTEALASPNPSSSAAELWEGWATGVMLYGEWGLEVVRAKGRGGIAEVWPRQGEVVEVLRKDDVYPRVAGFRILPGATLRPYVLTPDEFAWMRLANPASQWRGLSPFAAAATSIAIDRNAQRWTEAFFRDMARPDYIVYTREGITSTERRLLQDEIEAQTAGRNRGIVLEQGVSDVKPLGFAPKDMIWRDMRELSREEIGAVAGIPDEMMGWGRDTYENFDTARRVLWTETLAPLCRWRDDAFTQFFRRRGDLRPTERIETDLSEIDALNEGFDSKLGQAQRLYAMGVPFDVINQRLDLQIDYTPPPPAPAPEPAPEAPPKRAKAIAKIVYGSPEHVEKWGRFIAKQSPRETQMRDAVAALMEQMREDTLTRLRARKSVAKSDSDPFSREKWIAQWKRKLMPLLRLFVAEAGRDAADELDVGMSFDVTEPAVVAFMRSTEERFALPIGTLWERVREEIAQGIEAGETIDQIAARVNESMGPLIRSSSETIARTETVRASNAGTELAWKQSGVVKGKQWLSALDDKTRDSHVEANGQIVPLSGEFKVGDGTGPTPGQIGLPEEDINCRCTLVAVLD